MYGAEGLPRQALFDDGAAILDQIVQEISEVLEQHTQLIQWEPGDVVLLDNLRYAHGREPYRGARTVHIAMGIPCSGDRSGSIFPATAGS